MKRKMIAMTLAITVTLSGAAVSDVYQVDAAAVQEIGATDSAVPEDVSGQLIQNGGYLAEATDDGVMPLADIDDAKKRQIQEKLKAAWDSFSDGCDLTEFQLTREQLKSIYFETVNQNPRYFFVKGGYSAYYDSEGRATRLVNIGYSTQDTAKIRDMLNEYDAAVAKVTGAAQASWSDMEKALYINDYLARNCAYDTTYSKYDAYNVLVGHSAVCQGYALAFRELAQQLGLSCEIVSSDRLNHAWDLVKIDGSYYHVDVTWNDPVKDRIGRARHHYFMKSSSFFQSTAGGHAANDWEVTGGITAAAASNTSYDSYFWNDVDTGFEYVDGNWYGFDGVDAIKKYTCDGTGFTPAEDLVKIEDVWTVIGSTSYYTDKFTGLDVLDGALCYSGKDKIYELNLQTKTSEAIFELPDAQKQTGWIYGMHISPSGEIQYVLAPDPNVEGTVYKAELSSCQVTFDGNGADTGSMAAMLLRRPGQEYQLPANVFTKKGHDFNGWNTRADGSGDSFTDQAAVTQAAIGGSGATLYAQWEIETEHTNTEVRNAKEATCTEEGYTGDTYCKDCGTLVEEGEAIPKTEHSWNTFYTVDKDPTTQEAGQESIHCKNCDATKDVREIPKLEEGETQVYQITFHGNGSSSGEMEIMPLYTTGQQYILPENKFTRDGYIFKGWNTKADGSGDAYADQAAVSRTQGDTSTGMVLYAQWEEHEHTIVIKDQKDATCTEDGYTGDSYCEECGKLVSQGEVIEKKGHTEVIDEAVAATCTEEGKTQGSHCSVCSVFIIKPETIPAKGHSWETDYTIDKAPTTEETGRKSIHCSNCDERKDEQEIPKLTESEEAYELTFDGNGAESGTMDKLVITSAGQTFSLPANKFAKPGFTFKGWNTKADGSGASYADQATVSRAEGDTSTGMKLYAQWEAQAVHVHTTEIRGKKAATCTEDGYTGDTYCTDCGELVAKGEKIEKLGHSWNNTYTVDKAATYTQTGVESIHCKNCSEVKDSRVIPKLTTSGSGSGGSGSGGSGSGGSSIKTDNDIDQNKEEIKPGPGESYKTTINNADGSVTVIEETKDALGRTEKRETTTHQVNPTTKKITETVTTYAGTTKTETITENRSDGSTVQTQTVISADNKVVVTTAVTNADGSAVKTENKTVANANGSETSVTTTTTLNSEGLVTGITEKSVLNGIANTQVAVTVEKDGSQKVFSATAEATKQADNGDACILDADMVSQVKEAAGQDVAITLTVKEADGTNKYKLKVDTKDLSAGNKLFIYRLKSTGEYIMVNGDIYKVSNTGAVAVFMEDKVTYELVNQEKASQINKEVLKTVAARKSTASLKRKGNTQFKFSTRLNKRNVKSIRYKTSNKKVAAVSSTGKITGKKAGTATVKAVVTLKNGSSKTVSVKVRVK